MNQYIYKDNFLKQYPVPNEIKHRAEYCKIRYDRMEAYYYDKHKFYICTVKYKEGL